MEDNKLHPKKIVVEVPEILVGQEIEFRLRKGGKTINFGTVKNIRKEGNEVKLEFDETRPGLGKLVDRKDGKED
jgi:hypothetical protein